MSVHDHHFRRDNAPRNLATGASETNTRRHWSFLGKGAFLFIGAALIASPVPHTLIAAAPEGSDAAVMKPLAFAAIFAFGLLVLVSSLVNSGRQDARAEEGEGLDPEMRRALRRSVKITAGLLALLCLAATAQAAERFADRHVASAATATTFLR